MLKYLVEGGHILKSASPFSSSYPALFNAITSPPRKHVQMKIGVDPRKPAHLAMQTSYPYPGQAVRNNKAGYPRISWVSRSKQKKWYLAVVRL